VTEPTFIIAGERRSGTSTLAKWIQVHPEIYLHPTVDRAYFLDDAIRGRYEWLDGCVNPMDWKLNHSRTEYLSMFNNTPGNCKAIGEKSADYFFYNPCIKRISQNFPAIKIIISLRNPIERAWSHYWNEVGKGRETLSFEEAINQEAGRISGSDYAKVHLSYVHRGMYDESLKQLYMNFSKEQVYIVILERLINKPVVELQKLYQFLGVDPSKGLGLVGKQFNHNWTTLPYSFWKRNYFLQTTEHQINNLIKKSGKMIFRDSYSQRKYIPMMERVTRFKPKDKEMKNETRHYLADIFSPHVHELNRITPLDIKE